MIAWILLSIRITKFATMVALSVPIISWLVSMEKAACRRRAHRTVTGSNKTG
jgi:hypothetical protein